MDSAFIVTVCSLYGAAAWSSSSPDLRTALASRWRLVMDGSRSRFRMHESRRESMQAWATIVTSVSELYFAFIVSMRIFFPDRFVKPLYQDLQTWCCLAFLVGLRWTCGSKSQMSKRGSRCVTLLFNVSSILASHDIPKELLPASMVSRAAHGLFTEDPLFTVGVRIACLPLVVFVQCLREDDSDKLLGCTLVVVNEVISCLCMAFTLLEVDAALCKQEQAAMDLEKQIHKRELDMRETEKVLLAARKLLSVTCDCCERLTHDWQIIAPSPRALELLQVDEEKGAKLHGALRCEVLDDQRLPFLPFICPEDQQRFADFAAQSHSTEAPVSLHVRMTAAGREGPDFFDAQIFLVNSPGSLDQNESEYLIGIATVEAREPSQSMISIPEHRPLGVLSSPSVLSSRRSRPRSASSRSSCDAELHSAVQQALEAVDQVSLLIDLHTGAQGYCIRSAQLLFKEETPLEKLPKLYSWVRRRDQAMVEDWIQEHVNSWYATGACTDEICHGVKCRVAGTQVNFMVEELSTQGIACKGLDLVEENYSLIMKINLAQLISEGCPRQS